MKAKNSFIVLLFLFVPGFWMLPAAGQDASTNMTIVKEKILADRKLFAASNLDLTEAQGQAFWPIYDSYVQDLQKLGARGDYIIEDFATSMPATRGISIMAP